MLSRQLIRVKRAKIENSVVSVCLFVPACWCHSSPLILRSLVVCGKEAVTQSDSLGPNASLPFDRCQDGEEFV